MKLSAVLAIALVGAVAFACDSSSSSPVPTTAPTVLGALASSGSPTPAISCPSPTPCPGETVCPGCPEPITCPTCTTCPACPKPVVCPTCPEGIVCPACPGCPEPVTCPQPVVGPGAPRDPWGDECTAFKAEIEIDEILLDVAEKGALVDQTPSEVRALLEPSQRYFDQHCQGVPLGQPSRLAFNCALAGKWKGMWEGEMLFTPDPQIQVWINQFDGIIDRYCMGE